MSMTYATRLEKVVNPDIAFAALNCVEPYGEFKALVKVASATAHPAYLQDAKIYAEDVYAARFPCNQIEDVNADSNVISIEIREHITT